jgi:hypothetical protein
MNRHSLDLKGLVWIKIERSDLEFNPKSEI